MNSKGFYDIRVKNDTINEIIPSVIKSGNIYYEYTSLINALFQNEYDFYIKKFNKELKAYIKKIQNKRYITPFGIKFILEYVENEELKLNLARQFFGLRDMNLINKAKIGLSSLGSIENFCNKLWDDVNKFDLKQNDLLHEIELNEKTEYELTQSAYELKKLREDRRKVKDLYRLVNFVKTFLNKYGLTPSILNTTYETFLEIQQSIKNQKYTLRIDELHEDEWKKTLSKIKI